MGGLCFNMGLLNKRGQEMTLGTIIAIVLGLVVLIFLIYGFSTGWSNFWERITGYSGGSNVDTIRSACTLACSSQRQYDYCEEDRNVKYSNGSWEKGSCAALAGVTASTGQVAISASTKISIDSCGSLCGGVNVTNFTKSS